MPLLEVNHLSVEFRSGDRWVPVVSDVSFSVESGEVLALVGESGCGKSVTCMSLAKLLPPHQTKYSTGKIFFRPDGKTYEPLEASPRHLREIRGGGIGYIFQEPSVSLNPVFRVGDQIAEAICLHRKEPLELEIEVVELLKRVGIPAPERRMRCFPHELSGGMQQRVMIAMALAGNPKLLVADEPTTALDVTVQAQILALLNDIRRQRNMAIILVTHNLGIVAETAQRVAVMYAGHMVETAPVDKLLNAPVHPYTVALLNAVPRLHHREAKLNTIPGTVPSPQFYPPGCRFFGRCSLCDSLGAVEQGVCASQVPEWREICENHFIRCWHKS